MLKLSLKSLLLASFIAVPAVAEVDLKKQAAAMQKAAYVLTNFKQRQTDKRALAKAEGKIEQAWREFVAHLGTKHAFAKDLAFIHARSVTAAKSKKKIIPAWKAALKQIPRKATRATRINLYMEAGYAAAVADRYDAAEQYFGYARSLAVAQEGADKERAQLYMRLNELKTTGRGMEWRPLRDALSDFRKASEFFNMWSVPRLDALIGEAEIRVAFQPNYEEKRTDLAELKAKIILMQKNLDTDIPPDQLKRLRNLMYVLEDHWQL